jgi:hypothetical protein
MAPYRQFCITLPFKTPTKRILVVSFMAQWIPQHSLPLSWLALLGKSSGAVSPWSRVTLEPCHPGAVSPWSRVTLEPCHPGASCHFGRLSCLDRSIGALHPEYTAQPFPSPICSTHIALDILRIKVYNFIIDGIRGAMRSLETWEKTRAATNASYRNDYEYAPLDSSKREFRVLKLQKRFFKSELACELIRASVDNALQYEAVSYSWNGEQKE